MHYTYQPKGVCAMQIDFEINEGIISDVKFTGGCNGNLKAISKLVDGMSAEKISEVLLGNTCGMKGTSCADQLAKAVTEAAKAS
ncbi:uncharacterized protein TIGR03905 [Ruminococcaceae bacterium KH2T8]|nr:uncharacterized protein TIGR03905 [Ruminococcaceae bacterium KH2T8]